MHLAFLPPPRKWMPLPQPGEKPRQKGEASHFPVPGCGTLPAGSQYFCTELSEISPTASLGTVCLQACRHLAVVNHSPGSPLVLGQAGQASGRLPLCEEAPARNTLLPHPPPRPGTTLSRAVAL